MGEVFEVVAIAQKRGFIVYQCLTEAIAFLPFAGAGAIGLPELCY